MPIEKILVHLIPCLHNQRFPLELGPAASRHDLWGRVQEATVRLSQFLKTGLIAHLTNLHFFRQVR